MSRAEWQLKAKEKRLHIQEQAFKIVIETYDKTKDWDETLRMGDEFFYQLTKNNPQEKALILEAGRALAMKMKMLSIKCMRNMI